MLPASIALLAVFSCGLCLLLAGLCVFFRDMAHLTTVVFSIWFYLTPIIYPESTIPARWSAFVTFNPMTYFVACFREPLFAGALPSAGTIAVACGCALGSFALGWASFHANDNKYIHYL
jgi:ABC-type polysaccharide/polyol phosphate export permease